MAERNGTGARRKRLPALNAALLAGMAAGVADGTAVVLENPRSFDGTGDIARFVAGATLLTLAAAVPAGALAALARWPAPRVAAAGAVVFLFAWLGVRAHVRFFFGEPLASPAQAAVMAGILAASLAAGLAVARVAGGRLESVAGRAPTLGAVTAAALGALAVLRVTAPAGGEPVSAAPAGAGETDVLLVTLDTTRADHLSCYGYPRGTTPAIDRLARGGRTLAYVWSPIPLTNPSHSSMFTGKIPREHGVLNNGTALPDSFVTHAQRLAERGYACAAFVSGIPLKAGLSGLARGFALYDDVFSPLERVHPMLTTLAAVRVANRALPLDLVERRAEATCAAAERWLRASAGPRFVWVHLFDPHSPYDAPEPLPGYFRLQGGDWTAAGSPVREWPVADYDAEILRADRALAGLFRAFHEVTAGRGRVIVTADHGEGLNEHGELTHGAQLFSEDVTVPFVVASAGGGAPELGRGGPLTEVVGNAAVGILRGPWGGSWRSQHLIETFAPEGKTDRSAALGTLPDGTFGKLIRNQETGEETAYDLTRDPAERNPVAAPGTEWDALRELIPAGRAEREVDLDPETERRLRALGYIH